MFLYASKLSRMQTRSTRTLTTLKFGKGLKGYERTTLPKDCNRRIMTEKWKVNTTSLPAFKFTDYDCIGFDLDNTVCRYKIGAMIELEYGILAKFLVEEKHYSAKHLYKPLEVDVDFMLKGLILDVERGNVLHVSDNGTILRGCHGTKKLNKQELIEYYGNDCRWHVTDIFVNDPLHTWNGPISEKMRTLLDYFDMPASLVFARAIDSIDELYKGGKTRSYHVWPDLLDGLHYMFNREHFQLEKGGYFTSIKGNPDNYIHKCSNDLIHWFKLLHDRNKILFLITGSNVDFASYTAENALGSQWRSLFDVIIFYAKKPGFFTQKRPFLGLNGFQETEPVASELKRGSMYTHGNWEGLYEFLKKHSCKEVPKVLYVGDNLVQDVYAPSVYTPCDTVAVCEELQADCKSGYEKQHTDRQYLASSLWGSYFFNGQVQTIWKKIIDTHTKLCIPNLEYVASKPVDHEFR